MAIIPQQESKLNNFFKKYWIIMIIILISASLASVLFWLFNYSMRLNQEKESLQLQIDKLNSNSDFKIINQYQELKAQKEEMKNIAKIETPLVGLFDLIESLTDVNTKFSRFSIDLDSKTINLSGATNSYAELAKQIEIFENEEKIQNSSAKNINFNESEQKITFDFSFQVK